MVTIYRGREEISVDELRAHLANLLRVENIGFLLGSGASVTAGGQTMKHLWEQFPKDNQESFNWLKQNNFSLPSDSRNVDSTSESFENDTSDSPDIEDLFDELSIALAERKRTRDMPYLYEGKKAKADLMRSVIQAGLLENRFWELPLQELDGQDKSLQYHKQFLQKVTSTRQPGQASPWIFTTNYDFAIEWSAELVNLLIINGFIGVHNRLFSPQSFDLCYRNSQTRGEARFGTYNVYLVKLHGSLSWFESNDQFYESQSSTAKKIIDEFLARDKDETGLVIFPSSAKYSQTTGYLFGELFRRFSEFLLKSQSVIFVVGYSFNDEHINRLMMSAMYNPTLQIVIYYPEFSGMENLIKKPSILNQIIGIGNPRVTIVGGNECAHFDQFVDHLPEPTIYNESLSVYRKEIQESLERKKELADADVKSMVSDSSESETKEFDPGDLENTDETQPQNKSESASSLNEDSNLSQSTEDFESLDELKSDNETEHKHKGQEEPDPNQSEENEVSAQNQDNSETKDFRPF